jgi:drug/metabolite transporter (DMT)-like permease
LKKDTTKSLLFLHLSVLLFGFAGVIGKSISLPAVIVTFGRVLFSSSFLLGLLKARKEKIALDQKSEYLVMIAAGAVMALHWTSFMQSVQVSSVAIGTITFSTFPLFAAFFEPIFFREKLTAKSVICSVIMLAGVLILVPFGDLQGNTFQGILWGMLSSLTYAVLSLLNRKLARSYSGTLICLYEQGAAAVILFPSLFLVRFELNFSTIFILAVLGVLCTAVAHSLYVSCLKQVKVRTAGIISGMESVYGIVLAALILGTIPSVREILGGMVVLGVTFYTTFSSGKE